MCLCRADMTLKRRLWARRKSGLILTQVPSHQIGIVEVLHAQSNDVDEFLYDLHELHCSRIYLNMIKKTRRHFEFQHCLHDFNAATAGISLNTKVVKYIKEY